jgi:hypothetical protein
LLKESGSERERERKREREREGTRKSYSLFILNWLYDPIYKKNGVGGVNTRNVIKSLEFDYNHTSMVHT